MVYYSIDDHRKLYEKRKVTPGFGGKRWATNVLQNSIHIMIQTRGSPSITRTKKSYTISCYHVIIKCGPCCRGSAIESE